MGRECRRVPPDWVHPKRTDGRDGYQPMYGKGYHEAAKEWLDGLAAWPSFEPKLSSTYYWEYAGNPPDEDYHFPDWPPGSRTHYQMYEDTSEGTPISPVFATPEEVARWCADNRVSAFGTNSPATYEWWLAIAKGAWVPDMVMTADGRLLTSPEIAPVVPLAGGGE